LSLSIHTSVTDIHTTRKHNTMSAYGIYDMEIDYTICGTCKTEVFTWMAEVFACPACGNEDYKFSKFDDTVNINTDRVRRDGGQDKLGQSVSVPKGKAGKKRKRKLVSSDEESI
jgi:hypothetical protein